MKRIKVGATTRVPLRQGVKVTYRGTFTVSGHQLYATARIVSYGTYSYWDRLRESSMTKSS